jgi:hypothetical protein
VEVEKLLAFRSYASAPGIEGARLRPLKKHRFRERWFMEHLRVVEGAA